jgi:hypothetical protein
MAEQTSSSETKPKIGIQAQVIPTCGGCGAPGVYKSSADHAWDSVPGIQVSPGDVRMGQFVGEICPNCGAARSKPGRPKHVFKAKRGWLFGFGR